jgi:hypothetical protein
VKTLVIDALPLQSTIHGRSLILYHRNNVVFTSIHGGRGTASITFVVIAKIFILLCYYSLRSPMIQNLSPKSDFNQMRARINRNPKVKIYLLALDDKKQLQIFKFLDITPLRHTLQPKNYTRDLLSKSKSGWLSAKSKVYS